MVPAGYMAKRVVNRPDWLHPERVCDVRVASGVPESGASAARRTSADPIFSELS